MDPRKRTTIIILIGLTLLLGVGSFLVTRLIQQQSQAPTTSAAAGFGENATRDLYAKVGETYDNLNCADLITLTSIVPPLSSPVSNSSITARERSEGVGQPKTCIFEFAGDVTAEFTLYNYQMNSVIPNSAGELFELVNTYSFSEIVSTGYQFRMRYFYGIDYSDETKCRMNLFHDQNEFSYATLVYEGLDNCKNTDVLDFNGKLFLDISKKIDEIILKLTLENFRNHQ